MGKKGQVTIFIILGILIVVSGIIYFSFRETITEKMRGFSGATAVKEYIDTCFWDSTNGIVYSVGRGGGYVFGPEFSNETGYNYHYIGNQNYFPNLEKIEEEISLYTTITLLSCVNNFESFSEFEINRGKVEITTEIKEKYVEVNLNYPISIRKGNNVVHYEDFEKVIVPVRLGEMHSVVKNLIEENYYGETGVCINCITDLAYEHDFVFEQIYSNGKNLFVLSDFENEETEKPYQFIFLNGGPNEK